MNNFKIKLAQLIIFLGQNLFFVRGKIRNIFWRFILILINYDKNSDPINSRVQTRVDGVPFYFYFDHFSDVKLAFGKYNNQEIKFLKDNMKDGSVFVDIGSNIGFYTMNIASIFPKKNFLKILSIEPNPIMIRRQKENIQLLEKIKVGVASKIFLENYAISSSKRKINLNFENGYGPAILSDDVTKHSVPIETVLLSDILKKHKINFIDCLKIDIEGHEDEALMPFFNNVNESLFPSNIVIEHTSNDLWTYRDLMNFLYKTGYRLMLKTRSNTCLSFKIKH